ANGGMNKVLNVKPDHILVPHNLQVTDHISSAITATNLTSVSNTFTRQLSSNHVEKNLAEPALNSLRIVENQHYANTGKENGEQGNNKPWVNNPESSLTDLLPGLSDTASHESSGQLLSSCQMGTIDQMHMLISSGEFNPSVGASHRREVSLMDEDFFDYTNREASNVGHEEYYRTLNLRVDNQLDYGSGTLHHQSGCNVCCDNDLDVLGVEFGLVSEWEGLELEASADPGEVFDTLLCLRDDVPAEVARLGDLNDCITQAEEQIETKEEHVHLMKAKANDGWGWVGVSVSNKRRLVADLEALGEVEGAAKSLEYMRAIVGGDAVTLGELEALWARAQVGAALKAGLWLIWKCKSFVSIVTVLSVTMGLSIYSMFEEQKLILYCRGSVDEDYRLGRQINRVAAVVYNVEIQLKDQENMAQMNASKKELFIKKLDGLSKQSYQRTFFDFAAFTFILVRATHNVLESRRTLGSLRANSQYHAELQAVGLTDRSLVSSQAGISGGCQMRRFATLLHRVLSSGSLGSPSPKSFVIRAATSMTVGEFYCFDLVLLDNRRNSTLAVASTLLASRILIKLPTIIPSTPSSLWDIGRMELIGLRKMAKKFNTSNAKRTKSVMLSNGAALYIMDKLSEAAGSSLLEDKMKVVFSRARESDEAFIDHLRELCSALRPLEYMREMVAHDSARVGVLEQLFTGAHVGMRLKAGYAAEMEETG
nr:probable serine/threonine-protein kinase roco5 isoform X1 [Tanacetum cinerariifolium]